MLRLLSLLALASHVLGYNPTVSGPFGTVTGTREVTPIGGTPMDVFLGIPYGEKPGRFQKSVMKAPFTSVYNASNFGPGCPTTAAPVSEDCLFMKIQRPADISSSANLPVIFWPHGGGYKDGKNSDYDYNAQGDNFISRNVILAQPNYRVGVLGFWSTGTSDFLGNWGMWDVLLALQWVRQNIRAFGGNPNNIILMGQGSGGISANLMTYSPLSRDQLGQPLYKAAIMLSGTLLTPPVHLPKSVDLQRMAQYAVSVGCDTKNNQKWNNGQRAQVTQCIQNLPLNTIVKAQNNGVLYWHPVVDGPGGIYPQPVSQLAPFRPVVPMVFGTTHDETMWDLVVTNTLFNGQFQVNTTALNQIGVAASVCANQAKKAAYMRYGIVAQYCQQHYINQYLNGNQTNPRSPYFWLFQAVKAGSGLIYHAPMMKDAGYAYQQNNSQIYLLSFDYINRANQYFSTVESFHNFDLYYIENFFAQFYKINFTATDAVIQNFYGQFITNFAKTHNPSTANVQWLPSSSRNSNYMSIDAVQQMKSGFHSDSVNFWNLQVPTLLAITPCNITVTNRGVYILQVRYGSSSIGLTINQSRMINVPMFSTMTFHAVAGKTKKVQMTPGVCGDGRTGKITCTGTTLIGFNCQ